jgi:DNA-binding IclR family transcriptional regulator
MGTRLLEQLDLPGIGRPCLEDLVETTGESAFLNVRERLESVCVDRVDGKYAIRLSVRIGDRRPLNAGAAAKLLLAYSPDHISELLLRNIPQKTTENTIVDADRLRTELSRIREVGYSESCGESTVGAAALAAPIIDSRGLVIAALSLGGPETRVLYENRDRNIQALLKASAEVSQLLGACPGQG